MAPMLPPLDDSLPTLIHYVDFNSEHNGTLPCLLFPSADAPSSRLASLSFADLCNASHKAAHIFRPRREGPEDRVVAVILNTDTPLYAAAMLGLMRAGFVVRHHVLFSRLQGIERYQPYPMSPRNSVQGVRHMLNTTGSRRILSQKSTALLSTQVQSEMKSAGTNVEVEDLSQLDDINLDLLGQKPSSALSEGCYPASPKQFGLEDPLLYLHSSGSTGPPKSVPFPNHQVLQNLRRRMCSHYPCVTFC